MNAKDLMKKRFVSIGKNSTLAEFMGKVYNNYIDTERDAVVMSNGKYYGMTSKRFLTKTKLNPQKMKVEKITERVPVLNGEEDIVEVARLMFASDRQILPVIDRGKVIGIVKGIDVVEQINNIKDLRNLEVGEIATTHPITIEENDRIGKAVEMMREHHISRLPIVDKNNKLLNIVSLRDVIHHYLFQNLSKSERRAKRGKTNAKQFDAKEMDARALPIKNLATPVIITVEEEAKVKKVIGLLRKYNISSIVVTRFREPVGILTIRDLLKLLLREQITY